MPLCVCMYVCACQMVLWVAAQTRGLTMRLIVFPLCHYDAIAMVAAYAYAGAYAGAAAHR